MSRDLGRITIYRIILDMPAVADAMWVDEEVADRVMRDGRVASRWGEHWGARVGGLTQTTNTNEPWRDGIAVVSSADISVSNKTLTTAGVKFQASRFTGSGRNCTVDDLLESLDGTELVHVVDITDVPIVDILTVHTRNLRKEVAAGRLGVNGWKKEKFYDFIQRYYTTEIRVVHP